MKGKKKQEISLKTPEPVQDVIENTEWGEDHQERMVDHSERYNSLRHECKGRKCNTAFEKL